MSVPNWYRDQQDNIRASIALQNVRCETFKLGNQWYQVSMVTKKPDFWGIYTWKDDDNEVSCPNWCDLSPKTQQEILKRVTQ